MAMTMAMRDDKVVPPANRACLFFLKELSGAAQHRIGIDTHARGEAIVTEWSKRKNLDAQRTVQDTDRQDGLRTARGGDMHFATCVLRTAREGGTASDTPECGILGLLVNLAASSKAELEVEHHGDGKPHAGEGHMIRCRIGSHGVLPRTRKSDKKGG